MRGLVEHDIIQLRFRGERDRLGEIFEYGFLTRRDYLATSSEGSGGGYRQEFVFSTLGVFSMLGGGSRGLILTSRFLSAELDIDIYMEGKRAFKVENQGVDSEGRKYKTINKMWQKTLAEGQQAWYGAGAQYWEGIDSTVDGVLGGFPDVHQVDMIDSCIFINRVWAEIPRNTAVDCGAGIGRVTKAVLSRFFTTTDLVEQCGKYIETAKQEVDAAKVGEFYNVGLQDWTPRVGHYDCIWVQWVLPHLTDDDLVKFFVRCKEGLTETGIIVVKESVTISGFNLD